MAKWGEPRTEDLLAALHRIERVADIIANDRTNGYSWNAARANEIKELAQMAARMVQGPLDNGK
jgi:HAMP domain-containing protein